jgi:type IV secretion system protein VirD4
MGVMGVLILLFIVVVVGGILSAEAKAGARRIQEAYAFDPANAHGGARFANNKDLKKAGLFKGKGVAVGYSPDGRHALHYPGFGLLTVAAARMGKGATLICNALMSWKLSCIVVDPKCENTAITGHWRRRFGKVFVLNPFGMLPDALQGLKLAQFNPLDIVDPASQSFHAMCDKVAAALVWDEGREGMHFTTAARMLVSGVIAALMRHGAACGKNLVAVARVISGDIYAFCRLTVQSTNDPFIIQKLGRFAAPGAEAIREVTDVIATAITQLGFIGNAAIAASLSGSDFRFSVLKRTFITVYICLPLNLLDICDKYFRLILETALTDLLNEGRLNKAQRGKGNPVLCIVDEMAQLGPHMKSFANVQGMAAGAAGLIMWGILQDLSQLKGMFPDTWETFIQNCGVTMWFGARDQTTQEYVSKLSGTCEVLSRSRSVSIDEVTNEVSSHMCE